MNSATKPTIEIKGLETQLVVLVHRPSYRATNGLYFTGGKSIPTLIEDMQTLLDIEPEETLNLLVRKKSYIETELRRIQEHLNLEGQTIDEYIAGTIDAIDKASAKLHSYEPVPPIGPDPIEIMSFPTN